MEAIGETCKLCLKYIQGAHLAVLDETLLGKLEFLQMDLVSLKFRKFKWNYFGLILQFDSSNLNFEIMRFPVWNCNFTAAILWRLKGHTCHFVCLVRLMQYFILSVCKQSYVQSVLIQDHWLLSFRDNAYEIKLL